MQFPRYKARTCGPPAISVFLVFLYVPSAEIHLLRRASLSPALHCFPHLVVDSPLLPPCHYSPSLPPPSPQPVGIYFPVAAACLYRLSLVPKGPVPIPVSIPAPLHSQAHHLRLSARPTSHCFVPLYAKQQSGEQFTKKTPSQPQMGP